MNKKHSWIAWVVLAIIVLVGLIGVSSIQRTPSTEGQPALLLDAVVAGDNVKGNPQAAAVLVEYGDYQCPGCAQYDPLVKRLSEEFGDQLAVVYRHFPLRNIHKYADIAAAAAEAAGKQGKFWEMHEMMYAYQTEWAASSNARRIFEGYAQDLDLDMSQFNADIDSDAVRAKVENNFQSAMKAQLPGTPTFFLNGQRIANPGSYEQFKALIQAAIALSQ